MNVNAIPAPPQMRFLAELGYPHGASRTPNGSYALTFPHVATADAASAILSAAGYRVTAVPFNRRGLVATAPPRPAFNQRHAVAAHRLRITVLFVIFPVFYFSIPLYLFLGIRWYLRTRPSFPARVRTSVQRRTAARHARPNYI